MSTTERDGRVLAITLNREDQLNALCSELIDELRGHLTGAQQDDRIGCIVIRGAGGRAFCAGADLDEIVGADHERARRFINRGHTLMDAIAGSKVPVVAAVDGWALGGGLELALACHLIVSSTRSRFGLPEAKIGAMPGFGGTQRIFAATTRPFAMRLMLTGEPVGAREAYHHGLLSLAPVEPEDFDGRVLEIARSIARGSRPGQERILRAAALACAPAALGYEAALAAAAIQSADGQEGIGSFTEKRDPSFHRSSDD